MNHEISLSAVSKNGWWSGMFPSKAAVMGPRNLFPLLVVLPATRFRVVAISLDSATAKAQDRVLPEHVLIVGASGLIGSAVAAELSARGVEVTGLARGSSPGLPHWISADVSRLTRSEDWLPHLEECSAVVNCAGVLQDSPRDSTSGVHTSGVAALFESCERIGIKRLVHLSAIGVDRATPTTFSRSKLAGDEALRRTGLDWVILRPSVVVGEAAYGGSALFRGLAALPVLPRLPGSGPLQIVQLQELVESIVYFLQSDAPRRVALDVAGPERLDFTDVVLAYRAWMGWGTAFTFKFPAPLAVGLYGLGDFVGLLGWRPPVRSTVREEIKRGAVGDNTQWRKLTGIKPLSLRQALSRRPASIQEKWFAKLYFLKPLVLGIFSLFWITTGLISLGPGWPIGLSLLHNAGVDELAKPAIVAGALADIVIGLGIAYRPTSRVALWGAILLSLAYVVIGTILVPALWADPLGPMLKIWPILALNLVALAILDDR